MKIVKTSLFTVFFLFISLLLSCMGDEVDMGSCDPVAPFFAIEGLEASPYKRTTGTFPWAAAGKSEEVYSHLFHIGVNVVSTYHSNNRTTGGGANLYALTCPHPGYSGSKTGIDQLHVVTLNDYNENYSANDTINDMVMYSDGEGIYSDFKSLDEYVDENKGGVKREFFLLQLAEAPEEKRSEQAFMIIYILNNGDQFEAVTDPVMIRK